jgi:hypothetical protein
LLTVLLDAAGHIELGSQRVVDSVTLPSQIFQTAVVASPTTELGERWLVLYTINGDPALNGKVRSRMVDISGQPVGASTLVGYCEGGADAGPLCGTTLLYASASRSPFSSPLYNPRCICKGIWVGTNGASWPPPSGDVFRVFQYYWMARLGADGLRYGTPWNVGNCSVYGPLSTAGFADRSHLYGYQQACPTFGAGTEIDRLAEPGYYAFAEYAVSHPYGTPQAFRADGSSFLTGVNVAAVVSTDGACGAGGGLQLSIVDATATGCYW